MGPFNAEALAGNGVELDLVMQADSAEDLLKAESNLSLQHFVEHMIPKSVFESFSTNEILQIVVFSIFFGVALAAYGKEGEIITKALDKVAHIVLICCRPWFVCGWRRNILISMRLVLSHPIALNRD